MVLKRTYHISADEGQEIAKRLRTVERRSKRNAPEIKSKTLVSSGTLAAGGILNIIPTQIGEGTGADERIADKIRLLKVEVRGVVDKDIDNYILKLNTTSEPTAAVFTSKKGAFLLESEVDSRFQEMKHYRNFYVGTGASVPIKLTQKLGHIISYYNGSTSTSGIRNQVCFTMLNRDAGTQNFDLSVRLWYTDA